MPGSRRAEVRMLLPAMLKAANQLKLDGWQVVLLKAPTIDRSYLEQANGGEALPVSLVDGDAHNLLHAADAGVIASGTATLEAALLGCPHVILYRFSWLTYLIARLVIGQRSMGLPNVILGRQLFPELVQRHVTADKIVRSLRSLDANRELFNQSVQELQATMGPPGASRRAADELVGLLT
jgi:lipid-A-disaccharide synthase